LRKEFLTAYSKSELLKTKLEQQNALTNNNIILVAASEYSLIDISFMYHPFGALPSILVMPIRINLQQLWVKE
jgi:hypothetical protein